MRTATRTPLRQVVDHLSTRKELPMASDTPSPQNDRPLEPSSPVVPLAEATLLILGLGCRHCVERITRALERVDGAYDASLDYDAQRATVTYDPTRANPRRFIDAVIFEGADRGQHFDAEILNLRTVDPEDLHGS